MKQLATNLASLKAGGKASLARALSALEIQSHQPDVAMLLDAAAREPKGLVVGLTGPPGVGKSTLTNALIARIRGRGQTIAVIAVDPSSRNSGGALLGDRTRIDADPDDPGIFVRSMAARKRLGGVADTTFPAAVLMRALYDYVIVETVGVGQSETEIADCSDIVVFCAQPGSGDALQFMKAGVMEVPDIVLVTKGDMGAIARRAAADVRGALSLASGSQNSADVAIVSAQSGEGLEQALDAIARCGRIKASEGELLRRRDRQTRSWAEARLVEVAGQAGLAAIREELARTRDIFVDVSCLSTRIRNSIQNSLKYL
ncbi:ArgK/MeaB family GTPase [Amaricoccus macauensis]|uniref:ArgK/MeaB family GTPase n=1 Tax=Amaricoccus macauensis TaxID=57001 RepID=UPI003C7C0DBC